MQSSIMNCDLHDYLEIACLYHYQVDLILNNGLELSGRAKTTITVKPQKEFLIFQLNDKQKPTLKLPLEQLCRLSVTDERAVFKFVDFITGESS